MKLCLFLFALGSLARGEQTPNQNSVPKLAPYQQRALDKVLNNAMHPRHTTAAPNTFSLSDSFAKLSLLTSRKLALPQPSAGCAIPLYSARVEPNMDRHIRHQHEASADSMPAIKGLPVCHPAR